MLIIFLLLSDRYIFTRCIIRIARPQDTAGPIVLVKITFKDNT